MGTWSRQLVQKFTNWTNKTHHTIHKHQPNYQLMPHFGAVLLLLVDKQWCPTAYAPRMMTNTEIRYAQIEKETLAINWAYEKFSQYILGKRILLETDHKPLVPLMTYKHLDNLPPRILQFRLCLMWFDYQISHVPGKHLYTADILSRSPVHYIPNTAAMTQQEHFIQTVIIHLPASIEHMERYRQAQLRPHMHCS